MVYGWDNFTREALPVRPESVEGFNQRFPSSFCGKLNRLNHKESLNNVISFMVRLLDKLTTHHERTQLAIRHEPLEGFSVND